MSIVSFEDAFFPSEDTLEKQSKLLEKLINEERIFFIEQGLTPKEVDTLIQIEEQEISQLHKYQNYVSRRQMLESHIITIDQVRDDIVAEIRKES